jgi:hypothetical protein
VYLAVWRHSPRKDFLEIYYTGHCTDADRVASFDDPGIWWQSLSAIEDGAVVGFQVRATAGEGWYGATKLFMYDGKKFSKSYDSGEISEVTDLNGDGFPEVLEFLSEKGNPTGKVHIYVWRGNKFEMLTTVAADELYSAKVVARLKSGKLQSRKEDHHP